MNVDVNYVTVLLAGVASMAVGFLWYSPMLFGAKWAKAMGFTQEGMKKAQKEMGKWYAVSFVLSLITAYVLTHVMALSMNFFHYSMVTTGLTTAFWSWLGFIMPVQFTSVIFAKEKGADEWNVFFINTGYQLVSLLLMGVVLGMM